MIYYACRTIPDRPETAMTHPQPPQEPGDPYGDFGQPPYGDQQHGPAGYPPAGYPWGPPQGNWYGPGGPPIRRPGTVVAGAVLTYVGSGLLILLGLVLLIGSSNAGFRQGFAESAAVPAVPAGFLVTAGAVVALIGIALVVLALFAQSGSNGARIALTAVGGVFLLLQLLSILSGAPQAVVGFVWIAVAIALFWAGNANAWYRHAQP